MIIISQDKNTIVNFDNVSEIRVKYDGTIVMFDNTYDNQNDCSDILGKYETEERAKEVLQKIIRTIIEAKKVESADSMFGFSIIPPNTVYEMPTE